MVSGKEIPLSVNEVLFEVALPTVTLPPVAVKLPDPVPLLPTITFPMLRVPGLTSSWVPVADPVPANETVGTASDALLANERKALKAPDASGVNLMLIGVF